MDLVIPEKITIAALFPQPRDFTYSYFSTAYTRAISFFPVHVVCGWRKRNTILIQACFLVYRVIQAKICAIRLVKLNSREELTYVLQGSNYVFPASSSEANRKLCTQSLCFSKDVQGVIEILILVTTNIDQHAS